MASNRIDIDVKVDDKGTTKKVGLQSKKAAKSVDDLGRAAQTADRNLKGAAQASANGTKNFAKMAQGMGGTLVPAYAALAANVFAVTAAFGAFQRAAQIQQLETNLIRLGNVGGQNLSALADSLKDITDNAIDTEASLRAVAQGTTQGFSGTQLKGLTTIAKGASIALGRDMNDALDRLIRGVAKLEPEILDELGIIVRLDDAARDYAATLGKTANQLTAFEKQQAFANTVLSQGTKKFAGIAAAAEANPFDQLAASFGDLKKTFFQGVGVVLNPIAKLLSISDTALIGVLGLLASTIVNQLTPALGEMAQRSKESLIQLERNAAKAAAAVQSKFSLAAKAMPEVASAPAGFKEAQKLMKAGKADTETYKKGLKSITGAIGGQTAAVNKLKKAQKDLTGAQAKANKMAIAMKEEEIRKLEMLKQKTIELQRLQTGGLGAAGSTQQLAKARRAEQGARIGRLESRGLNEMQGQGVFQQFQTAAMYAGLMNKVTDDASTATDKFAGKLKMAGGSARLFGAALLNAIPVIGQILFVGGMLFSFLDSFINFPWEKTKIEKAADKIVDNINKISEASLELRLQLMQTTNDVDKVFLKIKNASGITDQLADSFKSLAMAQNTIQSDEISEYVKQIRDLSGGFFTREFTATDLTAEANAALREQGKQVNSINTAKQKQIILEEKINRLIDDNTVSAEQAFNVALAARQQAAASLGKDSEAYREVNRAVEELGRKLKRGEKVTQEYLIGVSEAVNSTADGIRRLDGAFEGLNQAITTFNNDLTALVRREDTPFTPLIASGAVLEGTLKTIKDELDGLNGIGVFEAIENRAGAAGAEFARGLSGTKAYTAEMIKQTASLITPDMTMEEVAAAMANVTPEMEADALTAAMADFNAKVGDADKAFRSTKDTVAIIKSQIKSLGRFSKDNAVIAEQQATMEKKVLDTQMQNITNVKEILQDYGHIAGVKKYIAELDVEYNRLEEEKKRINEDNLTVLQAEAAERKKLYDLENRILGVKRQTFNLQQTEQGLEDSSELRQLQRNPFFEILDQGRTAIDQEIKRTEEKLRFEKENQDTINAAKTAMIEAEYALLDARLRAEMEILQTRSNNPELTQAQRDAAGASAGRIQTLIGEESGGGTLGEARAGAIANVAAESEVAVGKLQEKLMGLRESKRDLMDVNVLANTAAQSLEANMTSALTSLIDGTKSAKQAFADMAKSIIADIAAMIAKQLVFNALKSMFGGFLPFAEGGVASGGFEAFAKGGYAPGGFRAFASGGTVNQPTLGLVGEGRYNEAIVPLPDGRSIPVQMRGGGSQQNNVTVNVAIDQNGQASSSTNSDGANGRELGNMIAAAVQQELQHQKRAGGILNPYGNA